MPVTLKDIARELNISVSTVSYALHGGSRTVPEGVKAQVVETARKLNYRPNRLARSLVTGRTNAIGVVPPTTIRNVFLSPFVRLVWNGIVNEAERRGQDLLLFTGHDRTHEPEGFEGLFDSRIDGLVFIAPPVDSRPFDVLQERKVPYATLNAGPEVPGLRFGVDNAAGVVLAMDHLVGLGHRRIAHLAGMASAADARARAAAFEQYVADHGLERFELQVQPGEWTPDSGAELAAKLKALPQPPTAVFCANDEMALGVYRAAQAQGIIIPDQLSVVGFDGAEFGDYLLPGLTTVLQPIGLMAEASLSAVLDLINDQPIGTSLDFVPELRVLGSTAPPAK